MRRSASEIIRNLEMRIARLEEQSSKKASRIPLKKRQLENVIMHLNDEFGFDEMDEEVDLELSSRDWTFEHSSVVKNRRSRLNGSKILVLSIEGGYTGEVYYAIFVETGKDDWTEMGLFEGINSYEDKLDRLERGM